MKRPNPERSRNSRRNESRGFAVIGNDSVIILLFFISLSRIAMVSAFRSKCMALLQDGLAEENKSLLFFRCCFNYEAGVGIQALMHSSVQQLGLIV